MDQVDQIIEEWTRERPDLDVSSMSVIGRLARVSHHLSRAHANTFDKHGLNASSFDVLATLRRAGAPFTLSPKQLLARTMVASGTMTNRLDRLELAGLVHRLPNPEDRRGYAIQLSDKGKHVIDATVTDHCKTQQHLTRGLKDEEREALNTLLTKWLAQFESPVRTD